MENNNLDNKTALILGWEFPPRMVGGLAIATYGIVEALRHHLHIILILPFKDENTPDLPNVTIYGLNEIENDFPLIDLTLLTRTRYHLAGSDEVYYYPCLLYTSPSPRDS